MNVLLNKIMLCSTTFQPISAVNSFFKYIFLTHQMKWTILLNSGFCTKDDINAFRHNLDVKGDRMRPACITNTGEKPTSVKINRIITDKYSFNTAGLSMFKAHFAVIPKELHKLTDMTVGIMPFSCITHYLLFSMLNCLNHHLGMDE